MCLILIAWQTHPEYPLVLAANRDERYDRPTLPLAFWPDAPDILGGRDLEAGGSWLACHRDGRFAAVTNVREANALKDALRSRGDLVRNYLNKNVQPIEFARSICQHEYAGFNLLLGSETTLVYVSNRGATTPRVLAAGIYGLSNHQIDTPWPKLVKARAGFIEALAQLPETQAMFAVLADRTLADDATLPDTGLPLAAERMLSSIFVVSEHYGTRASTVLYRDRGRRLRMVERRFAARGEPLGGSQVAMMSTGV